MFESFRKSTAFAIILMIAGILMLFFQLVFAHTFSLLGVVTFLAGLALLYLIHASKEELNRLRLEDVELRKRIEELEKRPLK